MLARLALRSDLAVVGVLVATVALMVVPLPTGVVDVLLAFNLGLSVLLLMVAFYLRTPVQFSTLPSVILIATVFRLSLSIAVTRLVLTQADAGAIIRTFGDFVVGGNIAVGLAIFLIITIVQFIVITKGGERIAEVAARFTLDALPGKQMAIDADVRAGEIDQAAARKRRGELERESQLYGAMDGAMKFVKGDAVAGLIIIFVNMIGGLFVGVAQHGMPFGEAGSTYTILTVGDGLMAQIPALFVSITAGVVVTRVAGGDSDLLGGEIAAQLGNDGRALWLAAAIAAATGLIPGFPLLVFLALSAALALLARRADRNQAAADVKAAEPPRPAVPPQPARVQIRLSPALARELDPGDVQLAVARASARLSTELGLPMPGAEAQASTLAGSAAPQLAGRQFRVELDGVPLGEAEIPPDSLLLRDDPENAELAGVPTAPGGHLLGLPHVHWVPASQRAALEETGVGFLEPAEALALVVAAALRRHAGQIVGVQETRQIIAAVEAQWTDLVREVQRLVSLQRAADLFRRLLDEGLTLRNLRGLLESMLEHGAQQDPAALAELVRASMRRQICHRYADPLRVIAAYIVDSEAEGLLRGAVQQAGSNAHLNLAEGTAAALVERVRAELAGSRGPGPVVLTALDVRRPLRNLLANNGVHAPVLSFHDLLPEFTIQPLGTIRLSGNAPADAPAPSSAPAPAIAA